MRRSFARSLPLLVVLGAVVVACASDDAEPPETFLQQLDLERREETELAFDPNTIVDQAFFDDVESVDDDAIQRFLSRTPYDTRRSFLETYQSNGIRASRAIANAARRYRINPTVFLVFAQVTQGLVGAPTYPFPPERIEYVFGCGCTRAKTCEPELAGFDRQVDCLGRTLRDALDAIAANARTSSGWGPSVTALTLDNVSVTPTNAATAVLYDRIPRVADGRPGGTWVFWSVWNLYLETVGIGGGQIFDDPDADEGDFGEDDLGGGDFGEGDAG